MPPPANQIIFDEDARREFLTGFHKRKLAKIDAAKKNAKERERQDRLQTRRQQRETLRERARENAALVEQAYGAHLEEHDDEWSGIHISSAEPKEDEYEGQETLATVTVVEDFDTESAVYGSKPLQPPVQPDRVPDAHPTSRSHKSKARKITYESKAARKAERQKQLARKAEKAELAGGKASRMAKSNARKKKGMRR